MKYPQLVSMPSEVSDWLEEQLDARGIDSIVYTRYILSLLHRDPVDFTCSELDQQFSKSTKVQRSGSSRKRLRYVPEWRSHVQKDPEQLKRLAAIECLMSASDQTYGIESLVDELCEKLKEAKENTIESSDCVVPNLGSDPSHVSPQDLANRYYAAFPPLTHDRAPGAPTAISTIVPKWFASPKKKGARKQGRFATSDDKLHSKVDAGDSMRMSRTPGKQRFGYFTRGRSDFGFSRSMAKSMERSEGMTDWDLFMFSNSFRNNAYENFGKISEEREGYDKDFKWTEEESMSICEDLPVDILDLLDSPSPPDYAVEMMNLANMRNSGNKNFIQCGTNITNSIWSVNAVIDEAMFDNNYNRSLDMDQSLLGMKFKSLTVDGGDKAWPSSEVAENETNLFFENLDKSSTTDESAFGNDEIDGVPWNTPSAIDRLEKWSEADYNDGNNMDNIATSLLKLNHNKEKSSFTEVQPGSSTNFGRPSSTTVNTSPTAITADETLEENLLTSNRSHFKPIGTVLDKKGEGNKYADGTCFVISGSLEQPAYKRSGSGSMYLETDFETPKKIFEYTRKGRRIGNQGLVLKFLACENDKACQTDDDDNEFIEQKPDSPQQVPCKKRVLSESEDYFFPGDRAFLKLETENCTCQHGTHKPATNTDFSFDDDSASCPSHVEQADTSLANFVWKSDSMQCDKCRRKNKSWNKTSTESLWQLDKESVYSIWNGGEVCSTCIGLNNAPPSLQQSRLREDITQDGEQLLSDLSTLQKSYMEQLPVAEVSYDIAELLSGSKERKRRHSPVLEFTKDAVPVHRGSWSISSPPKHERLVHVASVPTLHSVTL